MCGRYTPRRDYERIRRDLHVESGGSIIFGPRHNIAPTDQVPILHVAERGLRELAPMTWDIGTPARDKKSRLTRHINARVENLVANALWRAALRETRCVVVKRCGGDER